MLDEGLINSMLLQYYITVDKYHRRTNYYNSMVSCYS